MNGSSIFTVPNLAVAVITLMTVMFAIMMHYEVLNWLFRRLSVLVSKRRRSLLMMIVIVVAHIVEIWLFGIVYWLALHERALGSVAGAAAAGLFDCVYFSASTFTTVGYGDIALNGPIRILAGTEALVGLVMITWSASFTITELRRDWRE